LRTEIVLLEILLAVICGGDACKQWWRQTHFKEQDLKKLLRNDLANILQTLFYSEENVVAYLRRIKHIGARESGQRDSWCKKLMGLK